MLQFKEGVTNPTGVYAAEIALQSYPELRQRCGSYIPTLTSHWMCCPREEGVIFRKGPLQQRVRPGGIQWLAGSSHHS